MTYFEDYNLSATPKSVKIAISGWTLALTPMPEWGTTKDENHPHPSLPHRGEGIKARGIFI
ncbi:MAG: hypothetical protein COX16_06620 [Deltaproteobacteria bacterium CG23_combo_of_CG06-09_8_20_14_all_51_20]|nr:MAG: hypothetical protein COX16_06620 [Deltaproteobacteria bacterium CG23_combo_of_CG06-09_8_20_14_all_51_20]PIW00153.1 MAG: hypothetical protein COW41_06170 [Deltaproteobacteria bacterium CG17_big_fil_post_rev_8_21_14_2_50_51_6]PIY21775.1 MAG: hypothetical protein COZ11_15120 [Deltaproteobacteria bacterium CG_4_10_14_3_um_filter_51_14]PJB34384.1 MAG: hypothetical protein CO107_13380 [Deltaproteobacteria bacterium CG_4_9_14_3_um_filter_51_14]